MTHYENDIDRIIEIGIDSTSDSSTCNQVKKSLFRSLRNGYDVERVFRKLPLFMQNVIRAQCDNAPLRTQLLDGRSPQEELITTSIDFIDHMNTLSAFTEKLWKAVEATIRIESMGSKCSYHGTVTTSSAAQLLHCVRDSMHSFVRGEPVFVQKTIRTINAYLGLVSLLLQYVVPLQPVLYQLLRWCDRVADYTSVIQTYAKKLAIYRLSAGLLHKDVELPSVRVVQFHLLLVRRLILPLLTVANVSLPTRGNADNSHARYFINALSRTQGIAQTIPEKQVLESIRETTQRKNFRRCTIPHIANDHHSSVPKHPSSIPISERAGYFCNHETFARAPMTNALGNRITSQLNIALFAAFRTTKHHRSEKAEQRQRLSIDRDSASIHYQRKAHYDIALQSLIVQFIEQGNREGTSDLIVAYVRTFLNALEDCNFDRLTQLHLVSKLAVHLEMVLSSSQQALFPTCFDILLNIILSMYLRWGRMFPGAIHGVLGVAMNILWVISLRHSRHEGLWQSAAKFFMIVFPKGIRLHPMLFYRFITETRVDDTPKTLLLDWLLKQHGLAKRLAGLGGMHDLLSLYAECRRADHRNALFKVLFWSLYEGNVDENIPKAAKCKVAEARNSFIPRHNASVLLQILIDAGFPQYAQTLFLHFPMNAFDLLRDFCYCRAGRASFASSTALHGFLRRIADFTKKNHAMLRNRIQQYPSLKGNDGHAKHLVSVVLYLVNSERSEMREASAVILGQYLASFTRRCLRTSRCIVNIVPQRADSRSVSILADDNAVYTLKIDALSDVFIDFHDPITEHIRAIHDVMHALCIAAHGTVRLLFFTMLRRLLLCVKEEETGKSDRTITILNMHIAYYFHVHPAEKSRKVLFEIFDIILSEIGYPIQCFVIGQHECSFSRAFRHHLRDSDAEPFGLPEQFCSGEFALDQPLLSKMSLPLIFLVFRTFSAQVQHLGESATCEVDRYDDFQVRRYVLLLLVLSHPETAKSVEPSVWLALMEDNHPIPAILAAREFLRSFQERHQQLFSAWENIFLFQPEAYKNTLFRFFDCVLRLDSVHGPTVDADSQNIQCQNAVQKISAVVSKAFMMTVQGFVKIYYLKRMYEAKILNRI